MNANSKPPDTALSSRRRAHRLRMIAIIVSLLGITGVALVYLLERKPAELPDELTISYSKSQSFQMEKIYGKQGLLMANIYDALKQPDTQALIIVAVTALVAGGCLYFARLMDQENDGSSKGGGG